MILAIAPIGAGCGLVPGLSSDSPTTPDAAATATTFSGTLAPGGAPSVFTFSVAAGPVALTLTSLSPTTATGIGLGLGTPSGTTGCTLTNFTTSATTSSTAQITVTESAGSYCAQVYDPGSLAAASTFAITVSHF